jgi:hypothetical protein
MRQIMIIITPIEREIFPHFLCVSQMLNVSIFGNMADIYSIVQRTRFLRVSKHRMTAHVYWRSYLLLLFPSGKSGQLKKSWRVFLSISVRITIIHCVVYLFRIFKIFHGFMNKLVFYIIHLFSLTIYVYFTLYIYLHLHYMYNLHYTYIFTYTIRIIYTIHISSLTLYV